VLRRAAHIFILVTQLCKAFTVVEDAKFTRYHNPYFLVNMIRMLQKDVLFHWEQRWKESESF